MLSSTTSNAPPVNKTPRSCLDTIIPYTQPSLLLTILGYLDRAIGLYIPTFVLVLKNTYGTDFAANGKAIYHSHHARVRQKMLTAGREADYLEFNVKEGWEPLCKFLGREVPTDVDGKAKPFPRVNDRGTFAQTLDPYFTALLKKFLWTGVACLLPIVVIIGAWFWRRTRGF